MWINNAGILVGDDAKMMTTTTLRSSLSSSNAKGSSASTSYSSSSSSSSKAVVVLSSSLSSSAVCFGGGRRNRRIMTQRMRAKSTTEGADDDDLDDDSNDEKNTMMMQEEEEEANNERKFHPRMFVPFPLSWGSVKLDASDPYYDQNRRKQFSSTATPKVVFSSFALAVVVFNVPFVAQVLAKVNPLFSGFLNALSYGFNVPIFIKCSTAIFKICVLCVVVSKLILKKRLPLETPVVVSKLAFNVLLPCYLCTRVAGTLTKTPLNQSLMVLPFGALSQVIAGTICGVVLTKLVVTMASLQKNKSSGGSNRGSNNNNSISAAAIDIECKDDVMPRLGLAACAFGNTFTLPLVFLTEVLGAANADVIAGYIALYLVGWTPLLWTVGFLIIAGPAMSDAIVREKNPVKKCALQIQETGKRIVNELANPPFLAMVLGVIIGTNAPLREFLVPGAKAFAASTSSGTSIAAAAPLEFSFIAGVAKAIYELAVNIGAAALPMQMLVLAASLVKVKKEDLIEQEVINDAADDDIFRADDASASAKDDASWITGKTKASFLIEKATEIVTNIRKGLVMDAPDFKALCVACVTRFIVLPIVCVSGFLALKNFFPHLIPNDKIAQMVLLTMSCMPAAQNLVVLAQLRDETRVFAPQLAGLMLRQYIFGILPCTLWITAFTRLVV
jgi:predicted permease